MLCEKHYCPGISEGHVALPVILFQGQTLSTKEGYGLGANDSDPTVGTTCIIVTYMNAVCTMSSAAMDLPFLAASPPRSWRAGFTGA